MSEPVKWSDIDVKEDTTKHYEPGKISSVFNEKYIEYKSKGDENTSIEQYLQKIRPYLGDVKANFKNQDYGKLH